MKFIGNLCLFLTIIVTICVVRSLFAISASGYDWLSVIAVSIVYTFVYALLSNQYKGKHDD